MDPFGADELDLDDEDQPMAVVQTHLAARQTAPINHRPQNAAPPAWTPTTTVAVQPIPAGPQASDRSSAPPGLSSFDHPHHSTMQAPVSRIPGPAGRPGPVGGGNAGTGGVSSPSQEFSTPEWHAALQALGIGEFDGAYRLLSNPLAVLDLTFPFAAEDDARATVAGALALLKSDVLPRLLVYVVSLQHAHNGESYVKLRDPTGTIGGTMAADVLSAHPGISRGAVLLLEKVTVLKTPSPHPIRHLCVVPETIKRVVPRQRGAPQGGGTAWAAAQAQLAAQTVPSARPAMNVSAPRPPAAPPALQRPPPAAAAPPPPPPQPQGDTAEDLLADLEDDFSF
jgi:hypothetical protein